MTEEVTQMLLAVCHALPSSLFFTRRQTCAGPIGGHSKTGVRLEFMRLSCVVFLHRRACSFFFCVWFTTTPKRSNAREGARAPRDAAPASLAPTSPRRPPALRLAAGPCPARSGQSRLVGSDGHRSRARNALRNGFSRSNLKTGAKPKSVAVTVLAETNRLRMGARIAFI